MKVNILDTHDRLEHFKKQDDGVSEYCQKIIDQKPFGDHPFYIFAHKREIAIDERVSWFNEDLYAPIRRFKSLEDVPSARILWQPRLTKPFAQTNSMLFKGYPGTDMIKIIWIIPPKELWAQYQKGNLTEDNTICQSIHDFEHNRPLLEAREPDDLTEEEIDAIYKSISKNARWNQNSYEKV